MELSLARLLSLRPTSPRRRKQANVSLVLEQLEDRYVPSSLLTKFPAYVPPAQLNAARPVWLGLDVAQGNASYRASITSGETDLYAFYVPAGGIHTIQVTTPSSNLDPMVGLYDMYGNRWGANDDAPGLGTDSRLTMSLISGWTYYIGVTNWGISSRGSYSLLIDGPARYNRNLYIDFDGETISRPLLQAYANNEWSTAALDPENDGVTVSPFLPGWSNREQIISQIMAHLRADLNQFSITVRRSTGVVAGVGAQNVLVGRSNIQGNLGLAGDLDFGNNNATDIAIVADLAGQFNWPTSTLAQAMADVILHEAGHLWGLAHVIAPATGREVMRPGWLSNAGSNFAFENQWYAMAEFSGWWQNSYVAMRYMYPSLGSIQQAASTMQFVPTTSVVVVAYTTISAFAPPPQQQQQGTTALTAGQPFVAATSGLSLRPRGSGTPRGAGQEQLTVENLFSHVFTI